MYLFRTRPTGVRGWLTDLVDAGEPSLHFTEAMWTRRHRWLLWLLWLHPAALIIFAVNLGYSFSHGLLEASPVAFAAVMAGIHWRTRTELAGWTGVGYFASDVVVLHLFEGHWIAQLHFLGVVALLGLFRNWTTPLLGLATMLVLHLGVGPRDPHSVYAHADPNFMAPILIVTQSAGLAVLCGWTVIRSRDRGSGGLVIPGSQA